MPTRKKSLSRIKPRATPFDPTVPVPPAVFPTLDWPLPSETVHSESADPSFVVESEDEGDISEESALSVNDEVALPFLGACDVLMTWSQNLDPEGCPPAQWDDVPLVLQTKIVSNLKKELASMDVVFERLGLTQTQRVAYKDGEKEWYLRRKEEDASFRQWRRENLRAILENPNYSQADYSEELQKRLNSIIAPEGSANPPRTSSIITGQMLQQTKMFLFAQDITPAYTGRWSRSGTSSWIERSTDRVYHSDDLLIPVISPRRGPTSKRRGSTSRLGQAPNIVDSPPSKPRLDLGRKNAIDVAESSDEAFLDENEPKSTQTFTHHLGPQAAHPPMGRFFRSQVTPQSRTPLGYHDGNAPTSWRSGPNSQPSESSTTAFQKHPKLREDMIPKFQTPVKSTNANANGEDPSPNRTISVLNSSPIASARLIDLTSPLHGRSVLHADSESFDINPDWRREHSTGDTDWRQERSEEDPDWKLEHAKEDGMIQPAVLLQETDSCIADAHPHKQGPRPASLLGNQTPTFKLPTAQQSASQSLTHEPPKLHVPKVRRPSAQRVAAAQSVIKPAVVQQQTTPTPPPAEVEPLGRTKRTAAARRVPSKLLALRGEEADEL